MVIDPERGVVFGFWPTITLIEPLVPVPLAGALTVIQLSTGAADHEHVEPEVVTLIGCVAPAAGKFMVLVG